MHNVTVPKKKNAKIEKYLQVVLGLSGKCGKIPLKAFDIAPYNVVNMNQIDLENSSAARTKK